MSTTTLETLESKAFWITVLGFFGAIFSLSGGCELFTEADIGNYAAQISGCIAMVGAIVTKFKANKTESDLAAANTAIETAKTIASLEAQVALTKATASLEAELTSAKQELVYTQKLTTLNAENK